jgi:hypothetical protein
MVWIEINSNVIDFVLRISLALLFVGLMFEADFSDNAFYFGSFVAICWAVLPPLLADFEKGD